MANIFQDNSLPQSGTGLTHIDRKRRQELREKRLVHVHKEDDHEEQQYGGWNMTMHENWVLSQKSENVEPFSAFLSGVFTYCVCKKLSKQLNNHERRKPDNAKR